MMDQLDYYVEHVVNGQALRHNGSEPVTVRQETILGAHTHKQYYFFHTSLGRLEVC